MSDPRHPPVPEPPDPYGVRVVTVGTLVWALALLVLLPLHGRLADHGHDTWIWIAATGFGLGLVGIAIVRRRRARLSPGR